MGHTPSVDDELTLASRTGDQQEVEANYFAAELLIPRAAVFDGFVAGGSPENCLDLVFDLSARAARLGSRCTACSRAISSILRIGVR